MEVLAYISCIDKAYARENLTPKIAENKVTRLRIPAFLVKLLVKKNCPQGIFCWWCFHLLTQWSFLVPLIGGRYHIIPQLAVYTTYVPRIYCLLGEYISPTTYEGNLSKQLLIHRLGIRESMRHWPLECYEHDRHSEDESFMIHWKKNWGVSWDVLARWYLYKLRSIKSNSDWDWCCFSWRAPKSGLKKVYGSNLPSNTVTKMIE